MVTEDFGAVAGPAAEAAVAGGAPLPGDRPLGRPMPPKPVSRDAPVNGLLLLLLANGRMAPLPVVGEIQVPTEKENKVDVRHCDVTVG